MQRLVDVQFPAVERIVVVLDNLNTLHATFVTLDAHWIVQVGFALHLKLGS